MISELVGTALDKLTSGGPATGWLLAVYLIIRLHQLTDRQHKANLATIKALTTIKTVLLGKNALLGEEEGDE